MKECKPAVNESLILIDFVKQSVLFAPSHNNILMILNEIIITVFYTKMIKLFKHNFKRTSLNLRM